MEMEFEGTEPQEDRERQRLISVYLEQNKTSSPEEVAARLADAELRNRKQEQALEELKKLARIDGMTGLGNYRNFYEETQRAIAEATRNGQPVSLILMDIDGFKKVNDSWGHPAGDLVLKKVAAVITNGIREKENDRACRYGGEEIAVLLPETTLNSAIGIAERLRRAIGISTTEIEQGSIQITVSLGVGSFNPQNPNIQKTPEERTTIFDQLVSAADTAMYAAKEDGKNRTGFTNLDGSINILEEHPSEPSGMIAVPQKT